MKKKSLKEIKEKVDEGKYGKKIVKKPKKKKDPNLLIKLTIFLILILLLLIAYIVCSYLPAFNVKNIIINEKEIKHYKKEDVISCIKQDMYNNILKIDIAQMQKDIYTLPYVKKVKISKFFPSTLNVEIEEKEASFITINEENKYVLLDENCKVLEILDKYDIDENNYLISGVELDLKLKPNDTLNTLITYQFKTAKKIQNKFNERVENNKISLIDFKNKQITITINNATVKISNSEDFDYQMRYLNEILKNIGDKKVFIDLTSENPYSKEVY